MIVNKPIFVLVLLLGACTVFITAHADAQGSLGYDDYKPPYLAVNFARVSSTALGETRLSADVFNIERQISAGLLRFDIGHIVVDLGVDYQYTRYEYNGIDGRNRDLHRLQVPFRFRSRRGEWQYRGYVAPGVSTSSNVLKDVLNRGGRDDFFVSGRIDASRRYNDKVLIAGVAYDQTFGRPTMYPVFGAVFTPNERLRLRLAFPDPEVWYRVSERHSFTTRLFPAGHRWHVVVDDFASDFDYRVRAIRSQLTWSVQLGPNLTLDVSSGYEFDRQHHFTDDQGVRINANAEDQWLFAVGFRIGSAPIPYTNDGGP